MQRWTGLVFAALFAGAIALVVAGAGKKPQKPATAPDAGAALDGAAVPASEDAGDLDGGATALPVVEPIDPAAPETVGTVDAGGTLLPTGEAPPPLPAEAPKSVVFGVVLVTYRGAQGAPATSRPRDAALELAKTLAAEAKTDFKATVAKGDKGSLENAGRMPRGMLEPAPEFVLFTLAKGGVSDPVDTPRGFYVLQRIE